MIDIGVIGDKGGLLTKMLKHIHPNAIIKAINKQHTEQKYDIIVIDEAAELANLNGGGQISADITLLNTDSRSCGKQGAKIEPGQIITYGMGGKSCITASSIGEGSISICIQRILFAPSGTPIMPQELVSEYKDDYGSIHAQLGAYACGAICGIFNRVAE